MIEKRNNRDYLLMLIDTGEASHILQEDMLKEFNDLMKYELIAISGENIELTPLGKRAREVGVEILMRELRGPVLLETIPLEKSYNYKKSLLAFLLLIILTGTIFLVIKFW